MGTLSTMRSACWKRTASSWILRQTAASAWSIGSLFTPLYFAPMASWSKSGRFSSHTFSVSTVNSGQAWRYACRNASATAMEADLGPRGEDWMLSRCIGCLWVKGVSRGGVGELVLIPHTRPSRRDQRNKPRQERCQGSGDWSGGRVLPGPAVEDSLPRLV